MKNKQRAPAKIIKQTRRIVKMTVPERTNFKVTFLTKEHTYNKIIYGQTTTRRRPPMFEKAPERDVKNVIYIGRMKNRGLYSRAEINGRTFGR